MPSHPNRLMLPQIKDKDKDIPICPIQKKYVREANIKSIKASRAGVIVYTIYNNKVYFGMGVDFESKDITDFGGRVSYYNDKNVLVGALREFTEETLGVFGLIKPDQVSDCPIVYDSDNLILFIHLKVDIATINNSFEIAKQKVNKPEITKIVWLDIISFLASIKSENIMYKRVRDLLHNAGDFTNLL